MSHLSHFNCRWNAGNESCRTQDQDRVLSVVSHTCQALVCVAACVAVRVVARVALCVAVLYHTRVKRSCVLQRVLQCVL